MSDSRFASPYPSVDRVATLAQFAGPIERYGRTPVIDAIRTVISDHRARGVGVEASLVADEAAELLGRRVRPKLRQVFNLTGTVLHTNLGRALLAETAVQHAVMAMREACTLEYELESGGRGERDDLVENVLLELTGAEAAMVVNNNAAAVLLALAVLAPQREVIVSRGELIEIGGAFRIPDVMRSAGARLAEVGTTNRTHASDYEKAIGPDTAALMKVHTSNYAITGFTAAVSERELAQLARARGLPLIIDLGSGSLTDLSAYGLPNEPVVRDAIAAGGDVVTFSGDKLLGGPQAGLIVGKKALIDQLKKHPLKRALRPSKITLAALEATLLLYRTPDRLKRDLPTLRLLTRSVSELEIVARRVGPAIAAALGKGWEVQTIPVYSQVGSGSLPVDVIPSIGLALAPAGRRAGTALNAMMARLRELPIPVIGRIADNRLLLDLRCLEDEAGFTSQLGKLAESMGS